MKPKTLATGSLLVFVVATLGYLVVAEVRAPDKPSNADAAAASGAATIPVDAAALADPAGEPATGPRLIAYYFHTTQRCKTCLTIERYAEEALREDFADAFASETLSWQLINTDEPEHEHFVEEFGLTTSSLVLVKMDGGKIADWRLLGRVWELVGDAFKFKAYVTGEAELMLDARTDS